mmetsp:Transcript_67566/g.158571  ORF Transcript_67566/g.158571 Transcript_67566/m.158571 type:complete len:129 (-) Transcript_67566:3-389(-)
MYGPAKSCMMPATVVQPTTYKIHPGTPLYPGTAYHGRRPTRGADAGGPPRASCCVDGGTMEVEEFRRMDALRLLCTSGRLVKRPAVGCIALGKIREAINLWNTIAGASPDDTPARTVQKGLGWLESAT